ncbi:MAG: hypothetical protein G8345_17815 [Magnetococcales bacterium]|nr:hypothetical protein [Magnetococcales bacterium]NGZ28735.1 hypothetical protein [Magnetococcales bacterium]
MASHSEQLGSLVKGRKHFFRWSVVAGMVSLLLWQGFNLPVSAENASNLEPSTILYVTEKIASDTIHDPTNPDLKMLQDPAQALSTFPVGLKGQVDWVRAINEGVITPRASLQGDTEMNVLDQDIILTNTRNMPHVRFPHRAHTQWLACENCHPGVFVAKAGGNTISMNDIFRGRYCGTCHGRVAFSIYICQRCHSVMHNDSPKQWW